MTIQLNVLPSPGDNSDMTMITLGPLSTNASTTHGHQAPEIGPTQLEATANAATDEGPAYHFRTIYDRAVYLKDYDLAAAGKPRTQPLVQHPTFQPGETLWRCVFNETLIEGYIYTTRPTTPEVTSSAPTGNGSTTFSLPDLPYAIKLVEERIPNDKRPYCEKMVVQKDGTLSHDSEKILLDINGSTSKRAPDSAVTQSATSNKRQSSEETNHCHCQWMVQ